MKTKADDAWEVFDFLFGCLELFSRRNLGLVLMGYRSLPSESAAEQSLLRLKRLGLVQEQGRGKQARVLFTNSAHHRPPVVNPTSRWDTPWDGRWRVVTYDLPLARRKDRKSLWQALRAKKFGLLQQSVWLWPHALEPILREIVMSSGLPECFCGFEAVRLLLCRNDELVAAAWNLEEIRRRHRTYLEHGVATPSAAGMAHDLPTVGRLFRIEREAYQYAFSLDPLWPRELCPSGYKGFQVESRHQQYQANLTRRLRQLAGV